MTAGAASPRLVLGYRLTEPVDAWVVTGFGLDRPLRETKLASTKLAATFVQTFVETLPCGNKTYQFIYFIMTCISYLHPHNCVRAIHKHTCTTSSHHATMADPPPATAFMKVVVAGMIVIRLDQRHYTVCSCESMSRDKNLTYTCQHQKLILKKNLTSN